MRKSADTPSRCEISAIILGLLIKALDMDQPNSELLVEVTRDELPIHCPTPNSSLWNSHPRVYIPLDDSPEATCSYCGTVYKLVAEKSTST